MGGGGGSRPAARAMLHDALAEAEDFRRNPAAFGGRDRGSLLKRVDAGALLAVLDGRVPVIAAALADLPARFEVLAATESNIGRMTAAVARAVSQPKRRNAAQGV